MKNKKEGSAMTTTPRTNPKTIDKSITKETLQSICKKLRDKFMFGSVYLFLDLDINKYVIINYNSTDKFETMKIFDKQSIVHLIKSMVNTRIKINEVAFFQLDKDNIGTLLNSIQGVKKSFSRARQEFFTDTDYLPTLNLFKQTPLLLQKTQKKLSYTELKNKLTNYPRLSLLLRNNIGNQENIQWFLNWVSAEMNSPKEIMTTFVLIGEQGSGKSVLTEEIFKENIYHFSNVSILDNKTLKDNFNDIYNYKSFIILNEVSTVDLKENNQITQDLKRLISDGSYVNRGMHKAGVEKAKTFNMCMTTNKNYPVQIENGDRRFAVFGRGKKLLEMKEITEEIGYFIQEVKKEIKEFLFFVKDLDFDRKVFTHPIMTDLKQQIINHTNTKEDLMKSYFNTRNFIGVKQLLSNFDSIDFEQESDKDLFFLRLEEMFKSGIFANETLALIYFSIYEININEINKREQYKKAASFWGKILHTPEKNFIKINKQTQKFKVFDNDSISDKKRKLISILQSTLLEYQNKDEEVIKQELRAPDVDEDGEKYPF